jgi:hypothetical protein
VHSLNLPSLKQKVETDTAWTTEPSALVVASLRVRGVEAPEMVPDFGPLAVEAKDLG